MEKERLNIYNKLLNFINKAKKGIIIIDNNVNDELLTLLKSDNKKITIVSDEISDDLFLKYERYHNIEFKINKNFYDRYIIIDEKIIFHCSKKYNMPNHPIINIINDKKVINEIINTINMES